MSYAGPVLTVDLAALVANWQLLRERFSGRECAAVVKANAYGLGVEAASKALHAVGCGTFFVATLEEGIQLRGVLAQAIIYVFHGLYAGEEAEYKAHRLVPVLSSMEQVQRWGGAPFALHVDTGMNRLGLTQAELESLHAERKTQHAQLLMSHLACANEPEHPLNAEQLARFRAARALLPEVPASLCNSSGIFLGAGFHFDLARPGCALYGINPIDGANPVRPVATLSAPIIQLRTADRDGTVGYGATYDVQKGTRIAIVQMGYADGYFRSLSNKSIAFVQDREVPVIGRVSMDMLAVDVSEVPDLAADARVELMNARYTVNDVADAADTIGYEVLTRLGRRVRREYI